MLKIALDTFQGGSQLTRPHPGGLADGLRAMAQFIGKTKANAVAALTDNSGGAAADGTVTAVPTATAAPLAGDTCPTKAEAETALGTAKDALTELGAKIATFATSIPSFTPTNSIGGAAADGTIGAVTKTSTGAAGTGGTCVAKAGFNTCVANVNVLLAQLTRDANKLAVACGVAPLTTSGLTSVNDSLGFTYAALSTNTGTSPADGTGSISQANFATSMTAIADAVKEIATKLNALRDGTTPAVGAVAV